MKLSLSPKLMVLRVSPPYWNARVLISGLKKHFETLAFSPKKRKFEKKKRKK
jgi:hypothetical protein